jgi:hypothetical protein
MDAASSQYPAGDLRVSDAERDAALAELSEHFQAGRLTSAELEERISQALAARTGRELAALRADLPALTPTGAASRRAGPAWPVSVLACAICVAAVGFVVSMVTSSGHVRVDIFPWWLIPVGYLVCRRLGYGTRRRARQQDTRP